MAAQVTKTTMIGELLQIDENIAPIIALSVSVFFMISNINLSPFV